MDIGDWMTAAKELELCQEILKYTGYHKLIDLAVFDWLLVWVNAPLAHVYQFCLRKFSEYRFVELREEMVELSKICFNQTITAKHWILSMW